MGRTRKKRKVGVLTEVNGAPVSDETILLTTFPTEVWNMILDQVEDQSEDVSAEMGNLSETSPFFRNYYLPRRVTLLVARVIQNLQKYLGPEFLKCRLICSSWNSTIQDYYQNHPSHLETTPTESKNALIFKNDKYSSQVFKSHDEIREFLHHFSIVSDRDHNPFLARSVTFHLPARSTSPPENFVARSPNPNEPESPGMFCPGGHELLEDLRNHGMDHILNTRRGQLTFKEYFHLETYRDCIIAGLIARFLQRYGHHIWYCSFDLPSKRNGDVDSLFDRRLEGWLEPLKNVMLLKIAFEGNQVASSRRPVYQGPFPDFGFDIPRLETVQVLQVDNMPGPIFDQLLEANKHIVKLKVTRKHAGLYLFHENLPNLRTFSWSVLSAQEFLDLEGNGRAKWALEELHLELGFGIRYQFLKWSKIFQLIQNKWGWTLKRVEIQMPKAELGNDQKLILEETLTARWKLGKVKYLKVTLPSPAFIDFLLPMKSLEEVHIILSNEKIPKMVAEKRQKLEEKETIKFVGMVENMRSSNIWKKLPKLKKLEVTRGDEHFCSKVKNTKSS